MLEAEYLQECDRAELLGFPKPDRDQFMASQQIKMKQEASKRAAKEAARKAARTAADEILESAVQREQCNRVGQGLDELNARLKRTQKLANLIQRNSNPLNRLFKTASEVRKLGNERQPKKQTEEESFTVNTAPAKGDGDEAKKYFELLENISPGTSLEFLDEEVQSQLSKLDLLMEKAEMAEMSLSKQSKQMRAMASSPKKNRFFFF